MRPLWYEYPEEEGSFGMQESFMVGDAILVHPVMQEHATAVDALFPGNDLWYPLPLFAGEGEGKGEREGKGEGVGVGVGGKDGWGGLVVDASLRGGKSQTLAVTMDAIPVHVRGGHILARKMRPRRNTHAMRSDPHTLVVALNRTGEAVGQLYLDDGASYAYVEGRFVLAHFAFSDNTLTCRVKHAAALPEVGTEVERIVLVGAGGKGKGMGWTTATVAGDGASMEGVAMAVEPYGGGGGGAGYDAVVLKLPGVSVGEDFTIRFSADESSH